MEQQKSFFFPFTKNCFAFKFSNEKILQGVKKQKNKDEQKTEPYKG